MTKFESPRETRRTLQRENTSDIPTERTIKNIYDKFLETSSVQDRERPGRSSSVAEEKKAEIIEVLERTPMNTIRSLSREEN
jgi:transposase